MMKNKNIQLNGIHVPLSSGEEQNKEALQDVEDETQ